MRVNLNPTIKYNSNSKCSTIHQRNANITDFQQNSSKEVSFGFNLNAKTIIYSCKHALSDASSVLKKLEEDRTVPHDEVAFLIMKTFGGKDVKNIPADKITAV
jgi:hypothetical protein